MTTQKRTKLPDFSPSAKVFAKRVQKLQHIEASRKYPLAFLLQYPRVPLAHAPRQSNLRSPCSRAFDYCRVPAHWHLVLFGGLVQTQKINAKMAQ